MIKKAFTWAEVLLVIAIIGTVAALTIPNLMDNYSEDYSVTQLRKLKNEFDTAQQKAILKYGDDSKNNATYLMEFLDVTANGSDIKFPLSTYNGTSYDKYELKDGTIVSIYKNTNKIIRIALDGIKGNTIGKHIFQFNLSDGKINPLGFNADKNADNSLNLTTNLYGTNWAISIGNLDYLKCKSSLNWVNKTSCD